MPTSRSESLTLPSSRAFHSWWLASRPKTLVASFVPVIVASSLAFRSGHFSLSVAMLCLLCSLGLQVACNYINDASDFKRGADTQERIGPIRMAQSGAISARGLYIGAGIALGFSFLIGLYLVVIGGPLFLAIGLASILAAIAYTAGPFPLAYLGLGDFFVFIFFGLAAICGGYFLQAQACDKIVIAIAAALGLLATSIIAVNNIRDIPTDTRAGKRTLAVRLGRNASNFYYLALLVGSYALVAALCFFRTIPIFSLFCFLAFPGAVILAKKIFSAKNAAEFNALLEGSAKHQLFFSGLLSLGIACG